MSHHNGVEELDRQQQVSAEESWKGTVVLVRYEES